MRHAGIFSGCRPVNHGSISSRVLQYPDQAVQEVIRVQDTVVVSVDELVLVFVLDFRGVGRLEFGKFFRVTFFVVEV